MAVRILATVLLVMSARPLPSIYILDYHVSWWGLAVIAVVAAALVWFAFDL